MNTKSNRTPFEEALARLQYVLIARRVLASNEPMRLNWKHFDIMVLIQKSGAMLPSRISDELRLSRSSTSKYLKYLQEKALIATAASKNDRRSHAVLLTPLADTILENIYVGERENARLALTALTSEEATQFTHAAQKIAAALDSETLKTI